MIRNLASSLILYEAIDTTMPKAKEAKSYVERLIARSKPGDLNAIRRVKAALFDRNASDKLIKELLPRYKSRNSGFIRSYYLKNRLGDNATMMRLELVDKKVFVTEEATKIEVREKGVKKVAKEAKTETKEVDTKVKVKEKNDNK